MRVGQNPAKSVQEVAQPARVTVAIVTYIPFIGGYYAQALEVLKRCLGSIWAHTDGDYDLLVFDNASCEEVRAYLLEQQRQSRIQYLTLSEQNIGKAGAWNYIFGAAPGEFVAYADSDVYFYEGWLQPHLEALEAFSNAGMVTGMPMLTPAQYSTATVNWAESASQVRVEHGRFLDWEDFWRHAQSLGGDEPKSRQFYQDNEDIVLFHQDKQYYVGAAHFQFVARKSVLQSVLPIPSRRPMGEVRILDKKINAAGFLRLCLDQWYVQHMGNTLPEDESLNVADRVWRSGFSLWRFGPLRRLLQWVYNRSFEILYKS
ncbi:MAG: glycosyltransferase family 2 protein [Chloroflexi bacterium]|nr:MAG: glycosyltransferase family 2 protein [Chloroflexota bacterium]MBL1192851.1 glycosyltransferase family 2 protein [Chloroflexota bacterium]